MPRFSLRTLIILMLLAPPALAGVWFAWQSGGLLGWSLVGIIVLGISLQVWREFGWLLYWWDQPSPSSTTDEEAK